jgi:predicted ATPase
MRLTQRKMRIKSIEVDNLLSYGDRQKISFSPTTSLIVGPNNSGKTNIIRIIKLLIKTIKNRGSYIRPNLHFSDESKAFLNIKLILSKRETSAIIDFLSSYKKTMGHDYFIYNNHNILMKLLNSISINITWEEIGLSSQGTISSHISFVFEKIGLSVIEKDDLTLSFKVKDKEFRPSLIFLNFSERYALAKNFSSIEIDNPSQIVEMGGHYSLNDVTFARLIESMMKRGIFVTNRKGALFSNGSLGRTNNLTEDGSNLASFLYNLKMSSDMENRRRYDCIREKFEEIFQHVPLSFALVSSYDEDSQDQSKAPTSVSIFITQGETRQFLLDDSSAGLAETLYLLTLSLGLRESVVVLDEPALNLHPPLLKTVISKIITGKNDNQFVIITHSPELTDYLLFEADAKLFSIRKTGDISEIITSDKDTETWIKERRSQLSYLIDTRLFFGRALILVEGDSDKYLFIGANKHFASINPDLDLERTEIMTISADSKNNFPKYKKLLDAFKIPYVFIADNGIEAGEINDIFKSPAYITKNGIEGDNQNIYVIKDGNLEDYMNQISGGMVTAIEGEVNREYGRYAPKPEVARRFVEKIVATNPRALNAIKELQERIVSFISKYRLLCSSL